MQHSIVKHLRTETDMVDLVLVDLRAALVERLEGREKAWTNHAKQAN